ncbi:MAG TPA: 5'-nucleotidase C-terminal domain-containing protein [Actinopolymorphaceae bacterium]
MSERVRRSVSRRSVIGGTAAAVLAAAGFRPTPADASTRTSAHGGGHRNLYRTFTLSVLGTTDLHGHVFNWDYFADREYDDNAHDDVGLAKISTLVTAMRELRGRRNTLLVDSGDTLQGTPLAYYFAKVEPITDGRIHPMAAAMNQIGYDAAALGNHEFNYGIPLLRAWQRQLRFPLLGANAVDWSTGKCAFPPYCIKTIRPGNAPKGRYGPIRVGILGLTNPGIAIWDKSHVEGRMRFPGIVEQAKIWVPEIRRAGADVVLVSAHSGAETSSSYGDALPWPENASTLLAEEVPGIDALLVGHSHVESPERFVTNKQTGRRVLLTEPLCFGKRLSVMELDLRWSMPGGWRVTATRAQVLNSNTVEEDPAIVELLAEEQRAVVRYVNSRIGTSKQALSAATARYEDVPALDLVNHVQASAVKQALGADSPPVLSIAAPFNREAAIPAGEVSLRDIAALYSYDNTLLGVRLVGRQIRTYLEKSAEYYRQVSGPGPHHPDDITNAVTPTAPRGIPDYNYDVIAGLDAPLTYDIDIARPVGQRIVDLAYGGEAVTDDQEFVVAVNNYRQSGGGNFPFVAEAEVVYDQQAEVRQLLIDWVSAAGVLDPADYARVDWRLVADGRPLVITTDAE